MSEEEKSISTLFPQANDNEKVWRYLSFYKFIWLLENRQLYLPNITSLGDPFEGSLPKNTINDFEEKFEEWITMWNNQPLSGDLLSYYKNKLNDLEEKRRLLRDNTYVSCWSIRESESEALWKIYCKLNDGVAVKTTYKKLKKVASSDIGIIGKVQYIDYSSDSFEYAHPVSPFMYKRNSFDYEGEVRIIISYHIFKDAKVKLPN